MRRDESIYIRSASLGCEYRWYRFQGLETHAYDHGWHPSVWDQVSRWLVHSKPGLAVVKHQQQLACIFTGLLSPRQDNGRLIYDSLVIATQTKDWAPLQRGLLLLALGDRQTTSPLSPLAHPLKVEREQELIVKAPEWLEMMELLAWRGYEQEQLPGQLQGRSPILDNGSQLPKGVWQDETQTRQLLGQQLLKIVPSAWPDGVLALVTSSKSPQQLQHQARWALTTHSQAPRLGVIASGSVREQMNPEASSGNEQDNGQQESLPNTAMRLLTMMISFLKTWF